MGFVSRCHRTDVAIETVIDKKYEKGLDRIEDGPHAIIVYWMDKEKGCILGISLKGERIFRIFACRYP